MSLATNERTVVETKVNDLMGKQEAFTSVDVANAVKRDGTWIRNRHVASFLRDEFGNLANGKNYTKSSITVDSGKTATLYHPDFFDPENYDKSDQKALTPAEANVTPAAVAPTAPTPAADDDDDDDDSDDEDHSEIDILSNWIRVPAKLVKQLGLNPGDPVPAGTLTFLAPSARSTKVHKDGRIGFSRRRTLAPWNKITVCVKGSKIVKM